MSNGLGDHLPCLAQLEQAPIIFEKLLIGAAPEHLQWKPAPDRWSVSEVLAHLVDAEESFHSRTKKMVEEKNPFLESHDQNAVYASGKYSTGTAREHLKKFCHDRDRSVTLLRYLSPAMAARTARHAELGTITLNELIHEWAFHDLGHVKQISELLRARAFYPHIGGFQKLYTVKP
ncbi:MAG: DinB family protein [Acidobacteria bacterium]|nr:DinB family protein [Acidobacteriota bacterium]